MATKIRREQIETETKSIGVTILNPNAAYDIDTQTPFTAPDYDIIVTGVKVDMNIVTQNITGDIKYADDLATLTNATVIRAFDTTSGLLDVSGLSISVPAGKKFYIQFDAQPHADITMAIIQMNFEEA